ncbi:hypothetical protein H2O64_06605 [Kordia sp. YSTF-M3]|uniref:Uncharacterized protein n=1 Tax=Kordia aestuariivivens TaxID=2759037 RepID=A0ABR7Q701_9FLAO|nr:hypothetical protein [Kordia aestuariivivens]MBC8754334.1 hypothetical protein [Kordia aestuariivivens]
MDIEELILLKEHSQLLVMNSWRYDIPQEQRNIIIANALNSCVIHKKFHINGYLITNRRVFLIGSSETTPFQEVLYHFYYEVETGIVAYKKTHNEYDDEHHLAYYTQHKLFTNFPFYNEHIRSIITGKKVVLDYYDPNLARLKAYIHRHTYCSAIDYADDTNETINFLVDIEDLIEIDDDIKTLIKNGKSPVIVKKIEQRNT